MNSIRLSEKQYDDRYLPVAFSMFSTPGGYALLAGAGMSATRVPTAWEIVVELAQQICRQTDPDAADTIDADTVEDWYTEAFGARLSYSGLLEKVAPAGRIARERALRPFFENPSAEHEAGPSSAHHAVAELVDNGTINVIITTNFDHLIEEALRARGIEPVVIATDTQAQGLAPLHTVGPCVIHAHGEYRNADSMLNTSTELNAYGPSMHKLLTDVAANYTLIAAGWSAQHDRALRAILEGQRRRFLTPAWIDPNPNPVATRLAQHLGAELFETTADNALPRLSDAVTSMRTRAARHPFTATVVTDRIKTDLAGRQPAITAHDTFMAELSRLDELPDFTPEAASEPSDQRPYDETVSRIDAACEVPVAAAAALTAWGGTREIDWVSAAIEQWAHETELIPGKQHIVADLQKPLLVAGRLFYAAGVAAAAVRRYDLLGRLLVLPLPAQRHGSAYVPALRLLDWRATHRAVSDRHHLETLRSGLASNIGRALALPQRRVDDAWQEFDVLRVATQILTDPRFDTYEAQQITQIADEITQLSRTLPSPPEAVLAQRWRNAEPLRDRLASYANIIGMHVHLERTMTDGKESWRSTALERLLNNTGLLSTWEVPDKPVDTATARGILLATGQYLETCADNSIRGTAMRGYLDDPAIELPKGPRRH